MFTTDQKGTIAETAVVHAAAKLDVPVLKPVNDGMRYDLLFDLAGRFFRIQCKWAPLIGDVVIVRCYSCRRGPDGLLRRAYTSDEVDALAAYCPEINRCFLLPLDEFPARKQIQLRVRPTRNNQAAGINWADHFDFAATLTRLVGP
ncbi:MAG: group I intron-associated PD-(D/E)XK endonuclease [Gaiellaceae bacterium]